MQKLSVVSLLFVLAGALAVAWVGKSGQGGTSSGHTPDREVQRALSSAAGVDVIADAVQAARSLSVGALAVESGRGPALRSPPPAASSDRQIHTSTVRPLPERVAAGLMDADPDIRLQALAMIYGLNTDDAVRLLQRLLLREQDSAVYEEATAVLHDIGGEAAVAAISGALGSADGWERRAAVEALAGLGEASVHLLGQVLLGDPDPSLRSRAAALLAANGSPAAMALLRAAVRSGDAAVTDGLATMAADDWGYDGSSRQRAPLRYPELAVFSLDPTTAGLLNGGQGQRREAIDLLDVESEETALRILLTLLKRDQVAAVRQSALEALWLTDTDAADALIPEALGDSSDAIRYRAVELLGELQPPDIVEVLGQVLYSEPNADIRLKAIRLLGETGHPVAPVFLAVAQSDPDENVSEYARRLLGD